MCVSVCVRQVNWDSLRLASLNVDGNEIDYWRFGANLEVARRRTRTTFFFFFFTRLYVVIFWMLKQQQVNTFKSGFFLTYSLFRFNVIWVTRLYRFYLRLTQVCVQQLPLLKILLHKAHSAVDITYWSHAAFAWKLSLCIHRMTLNLFCFRQIVNNKFRQFLKK